jgi:hypothetical protein
MVVDTSIMRLELVPQISKRVIERVLTAGFQDRVVLLREYSDYQADFELYPQKSFTSQSKSSSPVRVYRGRYIDCRRFHYLGEPVPD